MSDTKLFPFQKVGVEKLEAMGLRGLLADSMGLGKTIQALTCIKNHPEIRPVLIVCPASIKLGWQHQAAQHTGMRVELFETRNPPGEGLHRPKIAVINYDLLSHWEGYLTALKPKMIIWDECHFLTNPGAGRTKVAMRLSKKCPHLIFVSGTPLTNRPVELWPVLNMLDRRRFKNRVQFAFKFSSPRKTPWGWDFSRPRNLRLLHRKLQPLMVRRLKEDVLDDLPAKARFVVPMALSDRKEYDSAEKDFKLWLRQSLGKGALMRSLRSEAGVRLGHLKRLAAKLKLTHVSGWVENFMEGCDEKLILFCIHKAVVKTLRKTFRGCAVVTGDVTGQRREDEFERFRKDKNCRLFVGNIHAAGMGWSAPGCSNVAFAELAWRPGDHDQAEDRTHGIGRGQKGVQSCNFYLVAAGTVEERICHMLDEKRQTLSRVLDGRKDEGTDIIDMLMEEMAKEAL